MSSLTFAIKSCQTHNYVPCTAWPLTMYTTGIMGSGLGFHELGNHNAGNDRSYELSQVTGSTLNVTGRGTRPSQVAVRGTERFNGKSPFAAHNSLHITYSE